MSELPRVPKGKKGLILSPETCNAIFDAVNQKAQPHPDDFIVNRRGKILQFRLRNPPSESYGGHSPRPYIPILTKTAAGTYQIAVTEGYVSEVIPSITKANEQHKAKHFTEPPEGGEEGFVPKLKQFAIELDQAIYIRVETNADGEISAAEGGDAITIVVQEDDADSVHYQPKVDNETSDGGAGYFMYRLAKLKAEGEGVALENILAGSNIYYTQGLPKFRNTSNGTAGYGLIMKKWVAGAKHYLLRVLSKGLGKLNIDTSSDEIIIRGSKKDASVYIWEGDVNPSTSDIDWKDGIMETGDTVEGDEDPRPDPQRIDIKIPILKQKDEDPQIRVTNVAVNGGKVYEVKGNGKNGKLIHLLCGETSGVTLLEWKDGQMITEGDVTIEAGCEATETPTETPP